MGIDHAALTDAGMGNIRIFLNTVPCFNGMDESLTFRSLITVTVSPLLRTLPLTSLTTMPASSAFTFLDQPFVAAIGTDIVVAIRIGIFHGAKRTCGNGGHDSIQPGQSRAANI
jgi:hypothetical protein